MIKKHYLAFIMIALSWIAQADQKQGEHVQAEKSSTDQSIDILLSNKTVEARYLRDVGLVGTGTQRLLLNGFLNTDNSFQLTAGLSTEVLKDVTPLKSDLKFSLGGRLYMSRLANPTNNVFSLGLGGGFEFSFPKRIIKLPLYLRGNYYFAPEVLTSGSDQDVLDFDILEAQLDLTEKLSGVIGFRELTVADRNLDNNWDIGIRYKF